jgi:hypothetical protein
MTDDFIECFCSPRICHGGYHIICGVIIMIRKHHPPIRGQTNHYVIHVDGIVIWIIQGMGLWICKATLPV